MTVKSRITKLEQQTAEQAEPGGWIVIGSQEYDLTPAELAAMAEETREQHPGAQIIRIEYIKDWRGAENGPIAEQD